MKNSYKQYVAEGTFPIYVAVIYSIILRVRFYLTSVDEPVSKIEGGYLWNLLQPYITDNHLALSYGLSFACAIGIALMVSHLNSKYSIIRKRTHLPFSITLLLLSSHHLLAEITPYHFAAFFFLLTTDKLFSSYQSPNSARMAFDFGFYFACGSLFAPNILLFLPLYWIGLSFMRAFSFKAILTSLLGVVSIYWIALFFFLSKDNIEGMYTPFLTWTQIDWLVLPFVGFNYLDFGLILFSLVILVIIIINNYSESYKDKIRVRGIVSFLNMILIMSILAYLFIPTQPLVFLFVALVTASLVVSHYFALISMRWQMYLFYLTLVSFVSYTFFIFTAH
ncbi:hypothetical protein [Dysgonomonas sp. 520]|uniref:hypothetical protein n=1 Tax=Dysgonomonas sp. 520 TaxID=2302931 RepID=UPI0013D19160|nr:hypothetical protein [Dysgonomonas sp. 520]NDW08595.1 hypothetical protein [Dysgonomonas sp. 520]